MPANETSFYKNELTKLEVYEIKENIKALESWLQRKDDRGNYTDGGRKRNYRAVKNKRIIHVSIKDGE